MTHMNEKHHLNMCTSKIQSQCHTMTQSQ